MGKPVGRSTAAVAIINVRHHKDPRFRVRVRVRTFAMADRNRAAVLFFIFLHFSFFLVLWTVDSMHRLFSKITESCKNGNRKLCNSKLGSS